MGNQVNFVYDLEDDPVDELKHWLFLENVKLNQQRQQLEAEREEFEREKRAQKREEELYEQKRKRERDLFEKQWAIVEKELVRMAKDRDKMARERAYIQREMDELKRQKQMMPKETSIKEGTFFHGVSSLAGLKKRYRELMKIYHPDNENGDEATVRFIQTEYEKWKLRY